MANNFVGDGVGRFPEDINPGVWGRCDVLQDTLLLCNLNPRFELRGILQVSLDDRLALGR